MPLDAAAWPLTEQEWTVVWLSLRVGLVSVALTLPPGIGCAWLLARRRFWGKSVLDAVVHVPLVLPPVVVGYLLLRTLGRRGIVGGPLHAALGIDIAFTWRGAAVASAVMGFPLLVRAARLSIEAVDPAFEEAAATLGAGPWRVFRTVTLPLAFPGVLAGAVLAFARSLGEFGATIVFAGNIKGVSRTLPAAIYTWSQTPNGDASVGRLIALSLVVSFGAIAASEVLGRVVKVRLGHRA